MKFKKKNLVTDVYYLQNPDRDLLNSAYKILQQKLQLENSVAADSEQSHNILLKTKSTKKRSRSVYKINLTDQDYFVKVYRNRSIKYIFRDLLRPQRGVRTLWTYQALQKRNIAAAEMLFAMIDIRKLVNIPSLVVSRECKGQTLKQLLQSELNEINKNVLLNQWIAFLHKLVKSGIYHHDPNLSNFIMTSHGLALIDIDDVYVLPFITQKIFNQMMIKLNQILLLAQIRKKNRNLNLNNKDREYILKNLAKLHDSKIDTDKYFLFLERKSKLKSLEITAFIND
jgi:hypothetical protein